MTVPVGGPNDTLLRRKSPIGGWAAILGMSNKLAYEMRWDASPRIRRESCHMPPVPA